MGHVAGQDCHRFGGYPAKLLAFRYKVDFAKSRLTSLTAQQSVQDG